MSLPPLVSPDQDAALLHLEKHITLPATTLGMFEAEKALAIISDVAFRGSVLIGANFTEAYGTDTGFVEADMSGARLSRVTLLRPDFSRAKLKDVRWENADVRHGVYAGACGAAPPDSAPLPPCD